MGRDQLGGGIIWLVILMEMWASAMDVDEAEIHLTRNVISVVGIDKWPRPPAHTAHPGRVPPLRAINPTAPIPPSRITPAHPVFRYPFTFFRSPFCDHMHSPTWDSDPNEWVGFGNMWFGLLFR
jgi:hypothetical protein